MNRIYSFRIPASTSNLGAGFDALSLALDRYLRVTLEIEPPSPSGRGQGEGLNHEIIARGVDMASIPTTADNLILRVARSVALHRNRPLPGFRMTIDNEIQLTRGM